MNQEVKYIIAWLLWSTVPVPGFMLAEELQEGVLWYRRKGAIIADS